MAAYIHPPAQKIGVLVHTRATPELARMVAMHIAAGKPVYLTRDEVPEAAVAEERGVYEKLPEVESKPEQVRERSASSPRPSCSTSRGSTIRA